MQKDRPTARTRVPSRRLAFALIWGLWALFCIASILWTASLGEHLLKHPGGPGGGQNLSMLSSLPIGHAPEPAHRVLVVHSYHMGYEWTAGVTRGLRRSLPGQSVQIETVYLDSKRRPEPAEVQAHATAVLESIHQWQPDVVILVDDNAQRYVGQPLLGEGGPPIVFCGVNGEIADYGYKNQATVTGVLERPHAHEALAFLQLQCPDVERVAILTDASPTSRGALKHMQSQLSPEAIASIATPVTLSEWKEAVAKAQHEADALYVYTHHVVRGDNGEVVVPREVMRQTVAASDIPVMAAFSFSIDDGALCGVVESSIEQGELAGSMARQILKRRDNIRQRMPVITATGGTYMLNLSALRRLGQEPTSAFLDRAQLITGGDE
jgi:ABC-type uncharacterized transport system substrate-binding protein